MAELIVLFFVCLLISGFFSGSETAVLSCSRVRIRMLAADGKSSARLLDKLLDEPNRLIATILIGNNLANAATASLATVLATQILAGNELPQEMLVVIPTLVATVFLLMIGEITPKGVAITFPEPLALFAARPLRVLQIALRPFVSTFTLVNVAIERILKADPAARDRISPDELRHMALMMTKAGQLGEHQGEMVSNVLRLSEVMARDVMVPRTEVAFLAADATAEQVFSVVRGKRRTRYPVFNPDRGIDDIIGLIHVIDLLDTPLDRLDELDIRALATRRQPLFVTEFMRVGPLFRLFQKERHQLAIVVDEYGGTAGVVTMEDIVEEIVGDILDEYEPQPIRQVNSHTFVCQGGVRLDELPEGIGIRIEDEASDDVDTLGGYIFTRLGRVPKPGERITVPGVSLIVRKLDGRRIRNVLVVIEHGPGDSSDLLRIPTLAQPPDETGTSDLSHEAIAAALAISEEEDDDTGPGHHPDATDDAQSGSDGLTAPDDDPPSGP